MSRIISLECLPKNWCIRGGEKFKEFCTPNDSNKRIDMAGCHEDYIYFSKTNTFDLDRVNKWDYTSIDYIARYTEITLETFKRLILKENINQLIEEFEIY